MSQDHDAGEVTVGYLVGIHNNITAITYRWPAMRLGRKVPPPTPETNWKTGGMVELPSPTHYKSMLRFMLLESWAEKSPYSPGKEGALT